LRISPDDIDVHQPLSNLGLDSRNAIALSGALEKLLGRELSPTLAWDYPTIEALAAHLVTTPSDE
jgi:acyl carrier protein